jgi:hypothetical protein
MSKRARSGSITSKTSKASRTDSYRRPSGSASFAKPKSGSRRTVNSRTAGLIGIEKKYYDVALAPVEVPGNVGWAGCEFNPLSGSISAISRGDGPTQRNGRKCTITSVYITGVMELAATTDISLSGQLDSPSAMVCLVMDSQTNGVELSAEDVYTNPSSDNALNCSPLRNMVHTTQFRVLDTAFVEFKPRMPAPHFDADLASYAHQIVKFTLSAKLQMPVSFTTASTADIANVIDNSLHVIANRTGADGTVNLSYNSRIRFIG